MIYFMSSNRYKSSDPSSSLQFEKKMTLETVLAVIFLTSVQRGLCMTARSSDCIYPGYQCKADCTEVIHCSAAGGSAVTVETCTDPLANCGFDYSSQYLRSCIVGGSCSSEVRDVSCPGNIQIPDAYDSSLSYICIDEVIPPTIQCQCDAGQCYNADLETCEDIDPSDTDACGRPYPECKVQGSGAAYPNSSFYYICDERGIARIQKCEEGSYPNSNLDCVKIPSDPNNPGTDPNDPETNPNITCRYPGEQFPASTCNSFYRCNASLIANLVTCYPGQHYEPPPTGSCYPGSCTDATVIHITSRAGKCKQGDTLNSDSTCEKIQKTSTEEYLAGHSRTLGHCTTYTSGP